MPYATGFHQAAIGDATRIAQATLHRDAQTHVMAAASVRQDTVKARRVPEAARSQRQRERSERDGERETPTESRVATARASGRHLDFFA